MRSSLLVVGLFGLHTKSRLEASLALSNTISATAHAWLKKNALSYAYASINSKCFRGGIGKVCYGIAGGGECCEEHRGVGDCNIQSSKQKNDPQQKPV